ncbi:MAG: hypothetical protein WD873_01615, partial [Candidatus Hydrogenedentales bacterium]
MMKRAMVTALTCAALALPLGNAAAQDMPSAEEVINKYRDASGTKDAKFKNRVTKGTFALPDMGMSGTNISYSEQPNMLNVITLDAFGEVKRGISGDVVWSSDPMQGARIVEGEEAKAMMNQNQFDQFANWKDDFESAEVVGEADVDGTTAWQVKVTPKEGNESTMYFAKDSGLLARVEATDAMGTPNTTTLSDYKEVDGVQVPHMIKIEGGMATFEITTESVEHDAEIPAGTFD